MSFAFDCFLAGYLLLASLTIWCAQTTATVLTAKSAPEPAFGPSLPASGVLRLVETGVAVLPNALGALGCLVAALALVVGTPFDIRYAAIAALGVALYLMLINIAHLIEDWHHGVPVAQMFCVRSLLPAILSSPMLIAGLRLM